MNLNGILEGKEVQIIRNNKVMDSNYLHELNLINIAPYPIMRMNKLRVDYNIKAIDVLDSVVLYKENYTNE